MQCIFPDRQPYRLLYAGETPDKQLILLYMVFFLSFWHFLYFAPFRCFIVCMYGYCQGIAMTILVPIKMILFGGTLRFIRTDR
jgi:hypothetical protein